VSLGVDGELMTPGVHGKLVSPEADGEQMSPEGIGELVSPTDGKLMLPEGIGKLVSPEKCRERGKLMSPKCSSTYAKTESSSILGLGASGVRPRSPDETGPIEV
jgi:hypothetical protein